MIFAAEPRDLSLLFFVLYARSGEGLQRLAEIYPHLVWLNPTHPSGWEYSGSTELIRELIGHHRMFPMTVKGVEEATKELGR